MRSSTAFLLLGLLLGAPVSSAGGATPSLSRVARLLSHGDGLPGNPGAGFGAALAIDGDTAVVGAPGDGGSGAVVVLARADGAWREQVRLRADDGALWDQFGSDVALSGDVLVVGAPWEGTSGALQLGAAYVFRRTGSDWVQEAKLTALDAAEYDRFGAGVAMLGETILVGVPGDDLPGASAAGSVRVFRPTETGWGQVQTVVASDPLSYAGLGETLSVSGGRLAAGAPLAADGAGTRTGAVYLFVQQGGTWLQEQRVVAPDGADRDAFGGALSIQGDTLAVGAHDDDGTFENCGSVYVFARSAGSWSLQQKLTAADPGLNNRLGESVALSGDTLLVGASADSTPAASPAGSAYLFLRSGATWTQTQKIEASAGAAYDRLGDAVALSLDSGLVGAPGIDTASGTDAGSVLPLSLAGGQWSRQAWLVSSDDASGEGLGALSLSGDTLVAGSAGDRTLAGVEVGSAYVFVRTPSGWAEQAKLFADDGARLDQFAASVAISGDTLVAGAPQDDVGFGRGGSAYVFQRTDDQWKQLAKLVEGDPALRGAFGAAVGLSGDSLIVGAPGSAVDGLAEAGAAYVFVRSGEAWLEQARLTAAEPGGGDHFGSAVSISGDVAVVGAPRHDGPAGIDSGAAYVFERSGSSWVERARLSGTGLDAGSTFGSAVSNEGSTAVVGAPRRDDPTQDAGAAYVFTRSGDGWLEQARLQSGEAGQRLFGMSTSLAGDRLAVGGIDNAFVFSRSAGAWSAPLRLLRRDAPDAGHPDLFGARAVAGSSLVAVSASAADTQQGRDAGAVYVFEATAKGDFDRDLQTDLLLRAEPGLAHQQWLMDGVALHQARGVLPDVPEADSRVVGVDDFDADGQNDLVVWSSRTGAVEIWLMNGRERRGVARRIAGAPVLPTNWQLAATGDFDADGNPDLLWRNVTSRKLVVWTMSGLARSGSLLPQPQLAPEGSWGLVAALDYDGDGYRDLLWRNDDSGRLVLWFMDAALSRIRGQFTSPASAGSSAWRAVAGGDFGVGPGGSAGTHDILWRNEASGRLVVWYMNLAGERTAGTFTAPDAPPDPTGWVVAGPR